MRNTHNWYLLTRFAQPSSCKTQAGIHPTHPHIHTRLSVFLLSDKTNSSMFKLTEFNKDILGGILDHIIEVLADKNLDWLGVPVVGNLLRVKVRLNEEVYPKEESISF